MTLDTNSKLRGGRVSVGGPDDGKELERLRHRQQKYMNALDDLAVLRDHYKNELKQRLESKVREQRIDMKLKKAEQKQSLPIKSEKPTFKHSPHEFGSHGISDFSFLNQVKPTTFYRMTKVYDKVEHQCQLRYRSDKDELWNLLSVPGTLEYAESRIAAGLRITFKELKEIHHQPSPVRKSTSLDTIGVNFSDQVKKFKENPQRVNSEQYRDKLEKIVPKVHPPKFQLLFKESSFDQTDIDEEKRSKNLEVKRYKRLAKQRKIKEMYDHATTYKVVTSRLLKKYNLGEKETTATERMTSVPNSTSDVKRQFTSKEKAGRSKINKARQPHEVFDWLSLDDVPRRVQSMPEITANELVYDNDARNRYSSLGEVLSLEALAENKVVKVTRGVSDMWRNPYDDYESKNRLYSVDTKVARNRSCSNFSSMPTMTDI